MAAEAFSASPTEQGTRRRWETADTVVAASLGLVAAVTAIFVLLCFQGYETALATSKAKAQRAAAVMAEGSRWILTATSVSLETAAEQFAADSTNEEIATIFDRASDMLPAELGLGLYSDMGQLVWGQLSAGAPASVANADFFAELAEGRQTGLGRLEPVGNVAKFAVARRLERNGVFAGIAVAVISGDVLSRFAAPQELGKDSTISLVRFDGKVVAREPPVHRAIDLSNTDAFVRLNENVAGSYVSEASPVDGLSRVVGYEHVDDLQFIALASISKAVAFEGLWYSIWVVSLLLAPFALVVLVGSFLVAKLLRKAESSSRSLGAALDRNEQLFREIHHRVKNNLQSVSALLNVHAIPREVRDDLARRIFAMSAVHEHIYRSGDFSDVRVKDYLHTLIENVQASAPERITVVDDLEDVTVDKDAAGPLGLILNEVLSNAFKHAFPEDRKGTVKVVLKRHEEGRVQLVVSDDGIGFDPATPVRGIGRKLIAGFVKQIGGQSQFSSEGGSKFVLNFPGDSG